jgi:hypothetical protein
MPRLAAMLPTSFIGRLRNSPRVSSGKLLNPNRYAGLVDPDLQRALGASAAVREFDERLGLIEDRVATLERSKNSALYFNHGPRLHVKMG